jgi:DNA polymerase III epsilon subunit-like protein
VEFVLVIGLLLVAFWWVRRRRAEQGREVARRPPTPRAQAQATTPASSGVQVRERPARPTHDYVNPGEREIPFAEGHGKGPLFRYGGPAGALKRGLEHDGPFAVIDLETTGLSPRRGDRIIELAVARVDEKGCIEDEYATLINPDGADTGPVFIHGISNEAVRDAPTFGEVAGELLTRLEGAVVVAHNACFEEHFLKVEFARAGISMTQPLPALCTLWLAQRTVATPNHRLGTLCRHHAVPLVDKHAALGDVRAVSALLPKMLASLDRPLVYSASPATTLTSDFVPGAVIPRTRAVQMRKGTDGWMASLMARLPMSAAEASGSQATVYLEALAQVLEDGKIIGEEARMLAKLAGSAGMGAVQVRALNHRFLDLMLETALEDERLTRTEIRDLQGASSALGEPGRFRDLTPTPPPKQSTDASPRPAISQATGGLTNDRARQSRTERASLAVEQQRAGMSRDEIALAIGVSTETVKQLLRDGKFYLDPTSDPTRLDLASKAAQAREQGQTQQQFRSEHALSAAKAQEAWRDAPNLHALPIQDR